VLTLSETSVLETVLRRDRWVLVAALVMVMIAAWIWIVFGAGTGTTAVAMTQMAGMPDMDMMMERVAWTPHAVGAGTLVPGRTSCFPYGHERPLSAHLARCRGCRRGSLN